MLFGDGVGYSSLFATHPPLVERIQALDRSFDPAQLGDLAKRWATSPPRGLDEDLALGFTDAARASSGETALPGKRAELAVDPQTVSAQVGEPASDDFRRAGAISLAIPASLREAAQRPRMRSPWCGPAARTTRQRAPNSARSHAPDENIADATLERFDARAACIRCSGCRSRRPFALASPSTRGTDRFIALSRR